MKENVLTAQHSDVPAMRDGPWLVAAVGSVMVAEIIGQLPETPRSLSLVLPLAAYLGLSLLWMLVRRKRWADVGLTRPWLTGRTLALGIGFGALCAIPALSNHLLIERLPMRLSLVSLGLMAAALLVSSPLTELFWRGLVQSSLEKMCRDRATAILIATGLFMLTRIPFFARLGSLEPLPEYLLIGFVISFAFYFTRKLPVAILANATERILNILAHSSEMAAGMMS